MSGKTDVQFFYVVVTTNENPGSNQSLASVRVLFDGRADRLPPCRTHANTFYTLQYDFVCVQTRFTPCNTISYACKHVLRLAIRFRTRANTFYIVATRFRTHANTFCALQHDFVRMQTRFTSLQQLIRGSIRPLHRCSKRFGGRNDCYIVAANDSGVNMTVTSLQQTIRGSK